jgi:hypothetical protein
MAGMRSSGANAFVPYTLAIKHNYRRRHIPCFEKPRIAVFTASLAIIKHVLMLNS